jgi:hypothetical protein
MNKKVIKGYKGNKKVIKGNKGILCRGGNGLKKNGAL